MNTLLDAPSALRVEEITSGDELAALRPEWEALWATSPRATPFQHPCWLLAWWRHLGGGEMRTLAVRDGDRLAGIWPMFVWQDAVRQLTPLGNGVSDHVDLLAAPGQERAVAGAIYAHLADAPGWDTADFRDLPADSPLLSAPIPPIIRVDVQDDEPCPVLALPVIAADRGGASSFASIRPEPATGGTSASTRANPSEGRRTHQPDEGLAEDGSEVRAQDESLNNYGSSPESDARDRLMGIVPRDFRRKLRYYLRRIDREFSVTWERARDPRSLDVLFDGLVRLHAARWAEQGTAGMLDNPRVVAFHREVAAAFLARGMLRLHALRLNGTLAAVWYGFAANRRTHFYLAGFDPAFDRFSVGTVIVGHALERARAEGATEFDFLRGREAYKYAWGAVDRPQRRIRLSCPEPR